MIAGPNVTLTAIRRSDSPALYAWVNDPAIIRGSAPFRPVHEPAHEAWLAGVASDPSRIVFGIRLTGEDTLIGLLQLIDIHEVHRSAELVIRIGAPGQQGRGLGTEAVGLALRFAFDTRNLQRVWLRVFADNAAAVRCYEKAGFVREGVMRRAAFIEGVWTDIVVMAALAKQAS